MSCKLSSEQILSPSVRICTSLSRWDSQGFSHQLAKGEFDLEPWSWERTSIVIGRSIFRRFAVENTTSVTSFTSLGKCSNSSYSICKNTKGTKIFIIFYIFFYIYAIIFHISLLISWLKYFSVKKEVMAKGKKLRQVTLALPFYCSLFSFGLFRRVREIPRKNCRVAFLLIRKSGFLSYVLSKLCTGYNTQYNVLTTNDS